MNKILKFLLKTVAGIIAFVILMTIIVLSYSLSEPNIDISPSAYKWKKGMSDEEIEKTTDELVNQMSLEEKMDQLSGGSPLSLLKIGVRFALFKDDFPYCIVYAGQNDALDIPPIAFSDGPRGVTSGTSTAFPVAMARGASWDVDLEERVSDAIGKECRALNVNYFGGLCVNILRHPAWGRAQETYGEDPYHVGEMGLALMKGVQSHNVMACAKHFAVNSIENSRFYVDVKLKERTLREVYLPQFKKLSDNGVASIMSAYNKLNGEHCGHNKRLLTNILRDEWGFKGIVSSDWVWGLKNTAKGINAGLDIEMPTQNFYAMNKIENELALGSITETQIDQLVKNVVRTKLKFVTTADSQEYHENLVASEEHTLLAREVAEKSMVLLKNKSRFLPLKKAGIKKLAVIGSLATENNLGDKGSSYVKPPYVVSVLEGITNYLNEGIEVLFADGSDILEASRIAQSSDAVLVVAGYDFNDEGEYVVNNPEIRGQRANEGGDRESLRLKPNDVKLIKAVTQSNANTVVSLIGGSAIIIEEWKALPRAIIMTWYHGMEGGNALANVLFGEVNPSGKLPFVVPKDESQLPVFNAYADEADYGYYHGYTLFDKKGMEPAFPFGYGLSYTSFDYDSLTIKKDSLGIIHASAMITNVGNLAGEEVVQLYVGFSQSAIDRPVKLLRGFDKIMLEPGESRKVFFEINPEELSWYNPESLAWQVEYMTYELFIGPSSDSETLLSSTFDIQ